MLQRVTLGIIALGLLSIMAIGTIFATPSASPDATPSATPSATPQAEASDQFEFLIAVLREASENGALTDEMGDALADWFIERLIAPETEETPDEISQRLAVDDSFEFLIAVLRDADENGAVPDRLSGLLSEMFIENLVAPKTGEPPDEIARRLSAELEADAESIELPAGWSGVLTHSSGAAIEVPEGSTDQATTVEVSKVAPPDDTELAGDVFDTGGRRVRLLGGGRATVSAGDSAYSIRTEGRSGRQRNHGCALE